MRMDAAALVVWSFGPQRDTLNLAVAVSVVAEATSVDAGSPPSPEKTTQEFHWRAKTGIRKDKYVKASQCRDGTYEYPDISLVLTLGDRPIDLIAEGVDCVVRAGVPASSAVLVARRVGSFAWATCAAPTYLARHGAPDALSDLDRHRLVAFQTGRTGRATDWQFTVDGADHAVLVNASLTVNDTDAYVTCGLEGLGLVRIADHLASPHLASGCLIKALPQYASPVPLSVIYAQDRHLPHTIRAFVEWIDVAGLVMAIVSYVQSQIHGAVAA